MAVLHNNWRFTTDHGGDLYGVPVLVAPTGEAFRMEEMLSVSDVAEIRGLSIQTLFSAIQRGSASAGQGWVRVGRKGGWAIRVEDVIRTGAKR